MSDPDSNDLPLIEADPGARHSLEVVARITGFASQTILQYREEGLLPVGEDVDLDSAPSFDDEALRVIRQIEELRATCDLNLAGLKMVLALLDEVEHLRTELRLRR